MAVEDRITDVQTERLSAALVKAEIDQQISTAKAYPRSVQTFLTTLERLVTTNETVADECIYALPRKEGGETKMIEGPSARFGELVLMAWKNCRAGARVVDEDDEFVTAQGFYHDLEGNVAISREVRRRITGRNGNRYSADMIAVTGNAACAIAQRNAVFAGIPKALWMAAYERARAVVAGSAETFAHRRAKAIDHLGKAGVPLERILKRLEIAGVEDMTTDHIVTLRGLTAAIRDGEIDVDEAFPGEKAPAADPAPAKQKGMAGLKAKVESKASPVPAQPTGGAVAASASVGATETASNDVRAICAANGCTKESAEGSFYCDDHKAQSGSKR